jgi:hypothetical protein
MLFEVILSLYGSVLEGIKRVGSHMKDTIVSRLSPSGVCDEEIYSRIDSGGRGELSYFTTASLYYWLCHFLLILLLLMQESLIQSF